MKNDDNKKIKLDPFCLYVCSVIAALMFMNLMIDNSRDYGACCSSTNHTQKTDTTKQQRAIRAQQVLLNRNLIIKSR